jgi:hypothetical protein
MSTIAPNGQGSSRMEGGRSLHELFVSEKFANRTFEPFEVYREFLNQSGIGILDYSVLL